MNKTLRAELEQMHRDDQSIRVEAMDVVRQHGPHSSEYKELVTRGRDTDARHVARLLEILEEHGWPGASLVGEQACNGAFLVLQHADPETQKRYVHLVRDATAAGEIQTTSLPLLEDRIRMRDGEKQIYGTQLSRDENGNPTLWPIEDEEHVHERRANVGLEPLDEYMKRFTPHTGTTGEDG